MDNLALLEGKYCIATKWSTWWCHQVNEANRGLDTGTVQDTGALRSFRSKKNLVREKLHAVYFISNEEKAKYSNDFIDRETVVARKPVEDA